MSYLLGVSERLCPIRKYSGSESTGASDGEEAQKLTMQRSRLRSKQRSKSPLVSVPVRFCGDAFKSANPRKDGKGARWVNDPHAEIKMSSFTGDEVCFRARRRSK